MTKRKTQTAFNPQSSEMKKETISLSKQPFYSLSHSLLSLSQKFAVFSDAELKAVQSLVRYVAHEQKVSEAAVCAVLTARFNVERIGDLTSKHYQDVIDFLLDLRMDHVIN